MQSKWTQYLQEKAEIVNVTVTTDGDAPAEKKAPFGKKEDKGDSPFPKKEKKDNPFEKKDKKESPFAKKSDGDDEPEEKKEKKEKKGFPFGKKDESIYSFPTWQEWVACKE